MRPTTSGAAVLSCLLVLCGCGGAGKPGARQFEGQAVRRGQLVGQVVDVETGAPVPFAEVEVSTSEGPRRVNARVDGSFSLDVPAGRARVAVRGEGFLTTGREVAVGEVALASSFRLARRAPAQPIGRAGGMVVTQQARLEAPPDAYLDGSSISLTFLPRGRVAAVSAGPQFVDDALVPRRVVAAATIEGSAAPARPVRLRVPVPEDSGMESVLAYPADPTTGRRQQPLPPQEVSGGFAVFELAADGRYEVAVDARAADGKRVGYLVVDGVEGAMADGQVLAGGMEIRGQRRGVAVVDPQGARIEAAAGAGLRLRTPTLEQPGETPPANDPVPPPRRYQRTPFAGVVDLFEGQARFLVEPAAPGAMPAYRFGVRTQNAAVEVTGTAFTLSTCAAAGGPVDVLEVVEGAVDTAFAGRVGQAAAGQKVTFCASCAAGAPPACGPEGDAGASDSAAGADAQAAVLIDAGINADAPAALDAVTSSDGPVVPDAGAPADVPAPAILTLAPQAQDFGRFPVGSSSAPFMFTLRNAGESTVAPPMSVDLAGADSGEFAISANGCTQPLGAGAMCQLAVRFVPTSMGAKTASLVARSGGGATASASLTGVAEAAAQLVISPPGASFGDALIMTESRPVTFTITNRGAGPTGALDLMLSDTTNFKVLRSRCGALLEGGASCDVDVVFAPQSAGMKGGDLRVTAVPGGNASAGLDGTGVLGPALGFDPPGMDFGAVAIGASSNAVTFTFSNTGGTATATTPAVQVVASNAFAITENQCAGPLQPAGACTVRVVFQPISEGPSAGTLEVNAGGGLTANLPLQGTGVAPAALTIGPSPHDFGVFPVGIESPDHQLTITNTGGVAATGLTVAVSNPASFVLGENLCASTLNPGMSCYLKVRFRPGAVGPQIGTVNVMGGQGEMAAASLSGQGLEPLTVTPPTLDMGPVVSNTAGAMTHYFTIRNSGGQPVGPLAVVVGGPNATDFGIAMEACAGKTLAPDETCTVAMYFHPKMIGPHAGFLHVTSPLAGPGALANLSGTGVKPAELKIWPPSLDFGSVMAGAQSQVFNFQVKNEGEGESGDVMTILSGGQATSFEITTTPCGKLLPGASCAVGVRYKPPAGNVETAVLTVSGTPGGAPQAALTGKGQYNELTLTTPVDFGASPVAMPGATLPLVIVNHNVGMNANVSSVSISGTHANDFTIVSDPCTGTWIGSGGGTCTITVLFTPMGSGPRQALVNAVSGTSGTATSAVIGHGM